VLFCYELDMHGPWIRPSDFNDIQKSSQLNAQFFTLGTFKSKHRA